MQRHRLNRHTIGLYKAFFDLLTWCGHVGTAQTIWGDDIGTADWMYEQVKRRYAAWQREATRCVEIEGSKDDDM